MARKSSVPHFKCPNCGALYQLVKIEAKPDTVDRQTACRKCGALLAGRKGRYILKYYFLREAARVVTRSRRS
jgi:predicted RNA-binding Zn-ribbon protein involved in translation (DUF1610 family)